MRALAWEKRRILIWGKTRPELSRKYREIVCTGGVFADTRKLVRLYPIPLRFMNDTAVFKKYQWIEAYVARNHEDPRPESYRIRLDGLELGPIIETGPNGNWDKRAVWIMHPQNLFASVEALQEKQREDRTSLGLVRPKRIAKVFAEPLSAAERDQFWQKHDQITRQRRLILEPELKQAVEPLSPPEYRFKIDFFCDDKRCHKGHTFTVLDWEVDALYFRFRKGGDCPEDAAARVVDKLSNEVCAPDRDLFFFLGNIFSHPQVFTIVGLWWPRKSPVQQLDLFLACQQ